MGNDLDILENTCSSLELDMLKEQQARDEIDNISNTMSVISNYLQNNSVAGDPALAKMLSSLAGNIAGDLIEDSESVSVESIEAGEEVSMEGITESLKKAYKAIKALVMAAIRTAAKWFKQTFSKTGRAISAAEAIIEKQDTIKGYPKEDKIVFPSMNRLAISSGIASPGRLLEILSISDEFIRGTDVFVNDLKDYAKAIRESDVASLRETNSNLSNLNDAIVNNAINVSNARKERGNKADTPVFSCSRFAGGTTLSIHRLFPKQGSSYWSVDKADVSVQEAPALDPLGIGSYVEVGLRMLKAIETMEEKSALISKACEEIVEAMPKDMDDVPANLTPEQKQDFAEFQLWVSNIKGITTFVRAPYIELSKVLADVGTACVQYAQASYKNLKTE